MEEGPCMMAEYEYEEAVRKFASARRTVEAVEAEIAQQGRNLERVARLNFSRQTMTQAERDLTAKIRAWEGCKQREASTPNED
jgi:hypothetical protein